MKTISSRFLKGALAIVLVVMMLFSSTLTGFAAVVDNAETNYDLKCVFIYDNSKTQWSSVQLLVGHSSWSQGYMMSKIANTDLWYYNMSSTWSGATQIAVFNASSTWGGENNSVSHRVNYMDKNSSAKSLSGNMTSGIQLLTSPSTATSSTDNFTLTTSYYSSYSGLNTTQTATVQSAPAGSSSYVDDSAAGSTTISTYKLSSNTGSTTSTGTTSASAARTATVTMTATANDGYTFVGWYNSSGTQQTTSTTLTYECTGSAATYYARFQEAGNSYTVIAGEGGTVSNGTNSGSSVTGTGTEVEITATPDTGYRFTGWTVNDYCSVSAASDNPATLTISGDGAEATANFEKITTTITFNKADGTGGSDSVVATYGEDMPAIEIPTRTGYTFDGYYGAPSGGAVKYYNADGTSATAWGNTSETYTLHANWVANSYTLTLNGNNTLCTFEVDGNEYETYEEVALNYGTYDVTVKSAWDEAGFVIKTITVDGTEVFSDSTGYVTEKTISVDVHADTTVSVEFEQRGKNIYFYNNGNTGEIEGNSWVQANSTVTPPETIEVEGYTFLGWYVDDVKVEDFSTYTITADQTCFTAKYEQITYDLTVKVPENVDSVYVWCSSSEFANVTIYEDTTISDIPYGSEFYVVAYPVDTYRLDSWVSDNADVTISDGASVGLYSDITVTPVVTRVYNVYVDGVVEDVKYASNEAVTIDYSLESDQYIDYITVTDSDGNTVQLANQDIDINNGTITFDMPAHDVYIDVTLGTKYAVTFDDETGLSISNNLGYYAPGEAVSITVSSTTGVLNSVTASGGISQTFTSDSDGVCTVIFTMPDADVTLTTEVTNKLSVTVNTVVYNPIATAPSTSYFPVTSTGIDDEGYTSGKITLTASIDSNYSTEYTFIGYYTDSAYTECIGQNSKLNYKVTEDNTTIYAVFAKNMYLPNSVSNNWSHTPMSFDPSTKLYSEYLNAASATFKLENASGSWNTIQYPTVDTSKNSNVTITTSSDNESITASDTTTYKSITLYYDGSTQKIYGVASTEAVDESGMHTVYLSSGNVSINGVNDTDYFDANSVITTEDNNISKKSTGTVGHSGESRTNEKYTTYKINGDMEIEFETAISGTSADTYYVYSYLIYGIESEKYLDVIVPSEDTTNVYTASHYITENCYIVPVFFRTDEYYDTTEGVKEFEFFFDARDIASTAWGPFVSVYVYGTDGTDEVKLNGGWPGQLMVPTLDGKSYYVSIEIPNGVTPQAVTFCNFMEFSVPASFFSVGSKQQSYDYREAITFNEQGESAVYFRAKPGDSNYHGDDTLNTTIDLDSYSFEYLMDYNNTYLMNFHGESMVDVEVTDTVTADYYIVAKGNQDYNVTTTNKYDYDTNYKGQWSVDWYVYDSNGKYITDNLSDSFYHNEEYSAEGTDTTSELLEALMAAEGTEASYYDDKKIAISYEQINGTRYDGQWYGGSNLESDAYVYVGLADVNGDFTYADMSTTNEEDYGTGYVYDADGNLTQHAVISSDIGVITLKAEQKAGYVFVGWYTFDAAGNPTKISDTLVEEELDLNFSESFYAVFRPVGENELVVNHNIYHNDDRTSGVPSHGGRAKLMVEVTGPDGTTVSGPYSNNGSSVSIPVTEGETYTITITTDPTGMDKFYAWYMATTDVNGNVAYEEVLMNDSSIIGTSDMITASFTYTYKPSAKNNIINLYSDMEKVSTTAKYVYQYKDRFGNFKYYTVTSELNQNELDGYAGNGGLPYYPTYITEYTLLDADGNVVNTVYGEDAFNAVNTSTYATYTSYNAVQKNAPSSQVTQAYDMDIEWVITKQYMTSLTESYVLLEAVVTDSTYTVEYMLPDGTINYIENVEYNYLLEDEVIAPETYNGESFSYWQEYSYDENGEIVDGEILCYTTAYNYRVTEDKCLKAVYGKTVADWNPTIDSVTYTRELSDSGDYVYTDYLLAFASSKGEILDELKANDSTISYGLITVRDSSYVYSEEQYNNGDAITYPIDNAAIASTLEDKVKAVAGYGTNKAFKDSDGLIYHAYCYNLTESETTDFNRMNYFVKYNLANANQKGYAFTCYAYLIIDGVTYISSPVNSCIANAAYAPVN